MSASCSQRLLSLWLRRLSTDRIERLRELSFPRRLVIYGKRGNAELLTAVDDAAERLGLEPGMALAQARAMHPALEAIEEDAEADASLLENIADWCLRYTPLVACDAPDGLLLDISGCAHLYGGEQELVADLSGRLEAAGFAFSLAVAGSIGAAWAAAHHGEPGSYASGEERELSGAAAARRAAACARDRRGAGARRLETHRRYRGFAAQPARRPLRRGTAAPARPRAGSRARAAQSAAAGRALRRRAAFSRADRARGRCAGHCRTAWRRGCKLRWSGAATARAASSSHYSAPTARCAVSPPAVRGRCAIRAHIRALFVERLNALADALDPGFGFDMARLSVVVAEPCPPEQIGIGGGEDTAERDRLIDRLSARLGARRVRRLVAQDSHIPEIAAACVPAQMTGTDPGWDAFRRYRAEADLAPRPLRLLTRPEPIEAVAEVPDGPPLRFRWRRALHEVIAAEGPERIEGAWWSEHGGHPSGNLARDYFRVEDKTGLRFWLFRAGLYRDSQRRRAPPHRAGFCTGPLREDVA